MSKSTQMIEDIEKNGISGKGRKEMLNYLNGERLTIRQMALAKCYDCMGFYSDGRGTDCEIDTCSLYPIMPYRKVGEKYRGKSGKELTPKQKQERSDRMRKMQAGRKHGNDI
jgi:hypothetical protein